MTRSRLLGLFVLLLSLGVGGLWMDYRATAEQSLNLPEAYVFEVAKGEKMLSVIERLRDSGIIRKPIWFTLMAYGSGSDKRLKYGEYEVPKAASYQTLLTMLANGKIRQYPVTLVEGWNFGQVRDCLARQGVLTPTLAQKSDAEVMTLVGAEDQPAEGGFFPDTYFVTRGTTDLEVLRRARQRMLMILDKEWAARDPQVPLKSAAEAVIAASLVEKETARADERPRIAGVFQRRLQQGMRLQTDPTVIFGLGKDYNGRLHKSDLRRDTPYNTYTRAGLPPTAIGLPGLAAIRAVLHPEPGDSLYFVARGDGSHVFSATLQEHERAVDQFIRHVDPAR